MATRNACVGTHFRQSRRGFQRGRQTPLAHNLWNKGVGVIPDGAASEKKEGVALPDTLILSDRISDARNL